MALDAGYHYTNGISYPHPTESRTQLYGDALQHLCRETNYNKLRLKKTLFKTDREKAHDIVRWEFGKPNKLKVKEAWFYEGEIPSWEDEGAIFNEETGQHFSCNTCKNKRKKEAEEQCYLCSTLAEHQQHTVRRGAYPQRKKKPKPRIQFIPPPPVVKVKEKEVEEKAEVLYRFSVKTGGHPNAGTNANVSVKLKGAHGIMRKRILKKKTSAKFVFGRNTTEVFFVKGPEIGDLSMLAVEHDGVEQSHAWYLEEVEVTKMSTDQVWQFVCKEWLSLYHGQGEMKKILRAEHRERQPTEYEISITTGDKMFAGTDANVYVTLYGRRGVSKKLQLKNRSKNPFEKGSTENFFVEVKENIGQIRRMRVEHDNSGSGPGWLLEQATVNDLGSGQKLKFPCGQWLATDEGDGEISRDLYPLQKGDKLVRASPDQREVFSILDDLDNYKQVVCGSERSISSLDSDIKQAPGKVRGPVLRYDVTVLTGKEKYAGTDARVYLTLIGKRGRSSEVELFDKVKDLFEMGQTDNFKIQIEDVGEIKRIRVRHDNSGLGAGWFLEKVTIKRYFPKEEIKEKLMKQHGEMAERLAELNGGVIESPRQRKPKLTGSVKVKKEEVEEESDSDDSDDMDAANIFSSYQKKKQNKTKDSKKKQKGVFDEEEESDDSLKKKYKKEKKRMEKKSKKSKAKHGSSSSHREGSSESESEDTEESESEGEKLTENQKKAARRKKVKWISYGGYKMQVTDDEGEEISKTKKSKKKKVKYPTDSSSSEESEGDRRHKEGRKYSKYRSDSEEEDYYDNERRHRKNNKRRGDKDHQKRGLGLKKKWQGRQGKGRRDSSGEEDEREKSFSSMYKKDRVPCYDEYLFECHRWLAKDEDDERIDREFKAQSVTTFYKVKD